jgi:hypothetical protein
VLEQEWRSPRGLRRFLVRPAALLRLLLLKSEVVFHMHRCRSVMIPFFRADLHAGRVAAALGGPDMALLAGPAMAAGVYIVACRSMDLGADRRRAEAADVGLE